MTCIVAMRNSSGIVTMGGDSLIWDTVHYSKTPIPKVALMDNDEIVIGAAGGIMGMQLLISQKPSFFAQLHPDSPSLFKMTRKLRNLFEKEGLTKTESGQLSTGSDDVILIGTSEAIFTVYTNFAIVVKTRMAACGSGGLVALSALKAIEALEERRDVLGKVADQTQVAIALSISGELAQGVGQPYTILQTILPEIAV